MINNDETEPFEIELWWISVKYIIWDILCLFFAEQDINK